MSTTNFNEHTNFFSKNALSDLQLKNEIITLNLFDSTFFLKIQDSMNLHYFFTYIFNEPWFFYFGILFLITTLVGFFFISYLGLYGTFLINIISLFFFWLTSLFYFFHIAGTNNFYIIKCGRWFTLFNNLNVDLEFYIDSLSISYMVLTLTISYFVQLYTFSYFRYEPLVERLILFLNNFIISMIFFVSTMNLILLFLGWELIGFTSFALINFWVTRKATLKSAFKAFVFNKISDMFFFLFIILNLYIFNSLDILTLNKEILMYKNFNIFILNFEISLIEILSLFLILAAFIKSAQLGFHLWLPDSMEAPVPASALIHSATLVSAGIFLLLRFNTLFELSNYVIYLIPLFGALTSLYGGLGAMFQSDVKRILAYSTISHCGFLVISFFFFSAEITLFYLYVHGFFKAAVFLCVGNVIRFSNNYQDFRKMGSFYKYLLNDCYLICFGLFNLGGLPFSLGFYMKHFFLIVTQQNTFFNSILLSICLIGAMTGVFYSFKLIDYVFFDFKKAKKNTYNKVWGVELTTDSNNLENKVFFVFSNRSWVLKIQNFFFRLNSTIANYSIATLFIFAYFIICSFLFFVWTDFNLIEYSYLFNNNYNEILLTNFISLWNLGYVNWLIIILLISVYFSFWRFVISYNNIFLFCFNFFLFTLMFCLLNLI